MLHEILPRNVQGYVDWLGNDANWVGRSEEILKSRVAAIDLVAFLGNELGRWQADFPRRETRGEVLHFDATDEAQTIHQFAGWIRDGLALVDAHLREPPPKPKDFRQFTARDRLDKAKYHLGTFADPIPIVFYKRPDDYEDIRIPADTADAKAGTYTFPDGPTVKRGVNTYRLKVKPDYLFKLGTKIQNTKHWGDAPSIRTNQVDINLALRLAGVALTGKDGDHVRDLGFGGADESDNYWPLTAHINRRPFLGWRALYGITYKKQEDDKETLVTAPLAALGGLWFVIKKCMGPGDGIVPAEGVQPDKQSGTLDL